MDFRKKFKPLHCINIQGNLSEQGIRITRCDNISNVGANNEDMVDSDERSDNLQCRDNSANAKLNPSMVTEPIIKYSEIYSKGKSEPNMFRKYYKI